MQKLVVKYYEGNELDKEAEEAVKRPSITESRLPELQIPKETSKV